MSLETTAPIAPPAARDAAAKARAAVDEVQRRMLTDLWRLALSDTDDTGEPSEFSALRVNNVPGLQGFSLDALLALQGEQSGLKAPQAVAPAAPTGPLALGNNEAYTPMIQAAATRTGLDPAMLAAIIGAEAASRNGVWDPMSANPRSSAAGLTQFLASSWETEAEKGGTWLNRVARDNGWLDAKGAVRAEARSELMAMRFNPEAAIETAADYARSNLGELRRQGLLNGAESPETLAKTAYLAHHLGVGDAARFLNGSIDPARARMLLSAQIGDMAARERVQSSGNNATAAHRVWLTSYIDRKIDIERYVDVRRT